MHTTTCLRPGVAEVLFSEMSHGMSQDGAPHFMHAMLNSCAMGWMQMLTKFQAVVMYIVVVAKEQPFMQKTGGITLRTEHCLGVCLIKSRLLKH